MGRHHSAGIRLLARLFVVFSVFFALFRDAVLFVHENHCWLMFFCAFEIKAAVGTDDHQVTFLHMASSGSIKTDFAFFAFDDVGRKSCAVIAVIDINAFVDKQARGLDQIRADADGAFIV
ncbi:hypothetical protein D3C72_1515250 [compost metagenome]